jgi:diguanylate cyclase (GGDEF)-like protein
MRRKNNDIIWVKEQGTPIFDENGNPAYFEGYIMDITEQKIAEEKLEYLSYHDALTNLYNRRYIEEQIDLLQIEGQFPISIIMGDVDNLKHINDNFGHEAGDYALKIIADSFVKVLGENGSVARIGGDEFLILLENYDQNKVEQFIHSFENGIVTSNSRDYEIRISIGYMIIYSDKQSIRSSIRQAEDKMYQQKKQRKR